MSASASMPLRLDPGVAEQRRGTRRGRSRRPAPARRRGSRRRRAAAARGRRRSSRASAPRRRSSRARRPRPAGRRRSRAPPPPPRRSTRVSRSSSSPSVPQRLLARALAAVDLLEDPVDHLQDDVVEHPLLVRERLDVPAQQRPEQLLDRIGDPALRPRPALERPVGADRPEPLGAVARGEQLRRARHRSCRRRAPRAAARRVPRSRRQKFPCILQGFWLPTPGHQSILIAGPHYGSVSSPA